MTVDRAPNVLMIQLKRFEFSLSGHKISKKVGRRAGGRLAGWVGGWVGIDGFSWVGGWVWLPCLFALLIALRSPPFSHCSTAPCFDSFRPLRCPTSSAAD
jgi:hypothetical protein